MKWHEDERTHGSDLDEGALATLCSTLRSYLERQHGMDESQLDYRTDLHSWLRVALRVHGLV